MNKKSHIIILYLLIIISLTISLSPILFEAFPFTFDQARDLIWVKNQIDFKKPSLIGPWGSLTGVYFGPLWFWLLTIPYILSAGNPVVTTLFNAFIVFSAVLIAALLFKKKSSRLAYFIALLGFLSPSLRGIAGFAFSQHLLPLFTILLIYSYSQILLKGNKKHFLLSFFWISLIFHAEPPISVFSLPSLFLISYLSPKRRQLLNFKSIFLGGIIFTIPFIPQIIFDLRHDFIQLKSVLFYIKGENQSLGDILPFWERLFFDRPLKFFQSFQTTILKQPLFITIFILLTTFYINIKKSKLKLTQKIWQASLIYVVSLFIIFTIYPPELKGFYLDGLTIVFILWTAIALTNLWQKKIYRKWIILYLVFAFYQNMNPIYFINLVKSGFADKYEAGSIFANQKAAVDWVYQDADGEGFKVYNYVSPVYDYSYQYLFFWYGLKTYDYLPEEFAYLPNKPEYVQKKAEQLVRLKDKIKPAKDIIYLIIENEGYTQRIEKWYANFPEEKFRLLDKKEFPGNITVEKRKRKKI